MLKSVSTVTVWTALLAFTLLAEPLPDQNTSWRQKMSAAADADNDPALLAEALKLAEGFGKTDARLFETVVRLAVACQYGDCEQNGPNYLERALKMRSMVKPADGHFADLLMDLGPCAEEAGSTREALLVYGEALKIREQLFGEKSQQVAKTYVATAWVYHQMNDPTQARQTMQYALEIRQPADQTVAFAELLDDSARLYVAEKHLSDGEREYERAMSIRERLWKPSDTRFIQSLKKIADVNEWNSEALAEKFYRRIVDIQKRAHTDRSEEYYKALLDLGQIVRSQKRAAEAERIFQDAFLARRQNDRESAISIENVARCRMDRGLYKEAAEAAEISVQLRGRFEQGSADPTLGLQALLAEAYLRARDSVKSEASFRMLSESAGSVNRYTLAQTAETLSTIYQERGDYPRSAEKLEHALAIVELINSSDPRIPKYMIRLSKLYQAIGRTEDANRMNVAVLRIATDNLTKDPKSTVRRVLVGIVVALVLLPIVGSGVCGLAYWRCARRVDRKLALLYQAQGVSAATLDQTSIAAEVDTVAIASQMEYATDSELMDTGGTIAATIASPIEQILPPPLPGAEPPTDLQRPVEHEQYITVRADGSVLFAMRVLNLLLSLLTLGIYSFWGKAKVRSYVCGQAEFMGDWFAFHGTGRELLVGWLRALPALAFIFLFPYVLPIAWPHKLSPYIAQIGAFVALFILWPVARVGAYRYRLNRMSWRGIRFSYRGKALHFLVASVVGGLLTVITLGIYAPFLQVRLRRLLFAKTYFGNGVFQFTGRGSSLSLAWLFALPLSVCSLGIGWAWWSALRHRYYWAHTTLAGSHFRCTATGAKLLWLWIGNFLIVVPTIGLGMSWAMLRTLMFWTRHIHLVGDPNLAEIRQDQRATTALGESFADFLGFDFGF